MILFDGIRVVNGIGLIKFTNSETKSSVEVPVAADMAKHISMHLSTISHVPSKVVERGNDEASD